MPYKEKNKKILINKNEYEIFCLIKEGMLGSCTHLMDKKEIINIIKEKKYKNEFLPYSFAFSPSELNNYEIINDIKNGQTLDLICNKKHVGTLHVKNKFNFDGDTQSIFSLNYCFLDPLKRFYLAGDFEIFDSNIQKIKQEFINHKNNINAQKITAIVSSLDPLHRAYEKLFRWTIDKADLIVIFLTESNEDHGLDFDLKRKCLDTLIQNYLPKDKIFVFPLKNIDIFYEYLNPELEGIIAKNLFCNKIVLGQNHTGLGVYYDTNQAKSIFDNIYDELGLDIVILPEFVFCNICKTSVSTRSCPHGYHHHIKFHNNSLKELFRLGIIPPTIFIRKEISAIILANMFPNRFKNLQKIYDDLFPNSGILEQKNNNDFYEDLLKLYQMSYMV